MGLTQQQRDTLLKAAVESGVAPPDSLREQLARHGHAALAAKTAGVEDLSGYALVQRIGEKLACRRAEQRLVEDGLRDLADLTSR